MSCQTPKCTNPANTPYHDLCRDCAIESIGTSNALEAIDQVGDYASAAEAKSAHIVNTVDTAREYKVNPTAAVELFERVYEENKTSAEDTQKMHAIWATAHIVLDIEHGDDWCFEQGFDHAMQQVRDSGLDYTRSQMLDAYHDDGGAIVRIVRVAQTGVIE